MNGDEDEVPPELKEEFKFWEDVSAHSWEKFLKWEREESAEPGALLEQAQMRPDRFFTEAQMKRLGDLMGRWRIARDQGTRFPAEEWAELEQLIEVELMAATQRAEAMLGEMQP
jgi:hypothetical protein